MATTTTTSNPNPTETRCATLSLAVQAVKLLPQLHLFVCANRRDEASPLGPGCSDEGDAVYDALKLEVARRGLVQSVWVTKTHCLGICPKHGATVARYPTQALWTEAIATDAPSILASTMRPT